MSQEPLLPPALRPVYGLLRENAGKIVEYPAFESVICCKKDRNLLGQSIYRLRQRGLRIENVSGVGYRLKPKRKPPVHMFEMTEQDHHFASDIQDAISSVMIRHSEEVGFESQMAIMGIAIGAILNQLPDYDCEHFTKVFIKNMSQASELSEVMRIQ